MSASILDDPSLAPLVRLALEEDRVDADVTSLTLVPEEALAHGRVVARRPGVVCGLDLLAPQSPLLAAFPSLEATVHVADGDAVTEGREIATVSGPARAVLGLERTLLNFLQRLSGIATMTARFVAAAGGVTGVRVQETRKTCPGWRSLDKYAVTQGGGLNHRRDLSDQMLVKDNHLVFMQGRRDPASIREAVRLARERLPRDMVVEIEVEDLHQLDAALAAGADVVMLDDFDDAAVTEAVARRNAAGAACLLEVSGGVDEARVTRVAGLGIDRISVGALTHSVKALDLAMDIVRAEPEA